MLITLCFEVGFVCKKKSLEVEPYFILILFLFTETHTLKILGLVGRWLEQAK